MHATLSAAACEPFEPGLLMNRFIESIGVVTIVTLAYKRKKSNPC
jgi:hypothetical protein